jgi:HSP20 family protein
MSMTAAPEVPYNPMRQPGKLAEQMQKAFFSLNETWTPNVNLYENSTSYLVCVDLAGVDKEKIDVEVADQRLKLRGVRPVPQFEDEKEGRDAPGDEPGSKGGVVAAAGTAKRIRVHLMEIDHGAFAREVELPPDADRESITANYRNGLLWIEIPKR